MKLSKILKLSLNMLLHSRLRSWLTIVGIFIGVAAVVAIISLGHGLQQNVSSQIQGLGQDIITISSGSMRAMGEGSGELTTNVKPLTDKDIQALKLVPGVKYTEGIVSGRVTVTYQSQNVSLSIQGDEPALIKEFVTASLEAGRYIGSGETRVVIIGYGVAHSTFRTALSAGSLVTINGKPFRVVGILASSSGFGSSDRSVIMPTKDARDVLSSTSTLNSNEYSSISVKVEDAEHINETSAAIEDALINSHHVTKDREDFSITSAAALQQKFSAVTGGLTLFLGIIAGVSLLVGGIGVANTMFTSVLEKTRDIGVMKAIGARNEDILLIFLFNSGLLGLVGGLFGVAFAFVIAAIVPYIGISLGATGNLTISISMGLSLFAIAFSVALGMAFGAIPAYSASKLNPVEALRYE
jgi:putative ABC transport system permease protein